MDSPSRVNKRNFVKQIRQNVTQFCCTCYHNHALFSHPTEDNKNDIRQKRGCNDLKRKSQMQQTNKYAESHKTFVKKVLQLLSKNDIYMKRPFPH